MTRRKPTPPPNRIIREGYPPGERMISLMLAFSVWALFAALLLGVVACGFDVPEPSEEDAPCVTVYEATCQAGQYPRCRFRNEAGDVRGDCNDLLVRGDVVCHSYGDLWEREP